MRVAMEQCGIVGVKSTVTLTCLVVEGGILTGSKASILMCSNRTTASCSNVNGCSGSLIFLMSANISSGVYKSGQAGSQVDGLFESGREESRLEGNCDDDDDDGVV